MKNPPQGVFWGGGGVWLESCEQHDHSGSVGNSFGESSHATTAVQIFRDSPGLKDLLNLRHSEHLGFVFCSFLKKILLGGEGRFHEVLKITLPVLTPPLAFYFGSPWT